MLDDVFLKQYIEFLTIAKKKFGHLALLDKDFNIIFVSDLALVSFQDAIEEDVIGLNFIKEIPRPIHLITKKQKILNEVLHLKEPRMYIAIASHNQYKYRKVVICASPICNPETKNVVAIELTGGVTNQNVLLSDNEKALFDRSETFDFLTNYELEIIYFKCKGKTDKNISLILSNYYQREITAKMINHTIYRSIFYKMQVNNVHDLKKKAKDLGIDKIDIDSVLPKDDIILL